MKTLKRERFPELRKMANELAGVMDDLSPDMRSVALATADALYVDLKADLDLQFSVAC